MQAFVHKQRFNSSKSYNDLLELHFEASSSDHHKSQETACEQSHCKFGTKLERQTLQLFGKQHKIRHQFCLRNKVVNKIVSK